MARPGHYRMAASEPADPYVRARALPMGTRVRVTVPGSRPHEGSIVPSHELSEDRVVLLKLDSGYNVGVRLPPTAQLEVVAAASTGSNHAARSGKGHPAGPGTGRAISLLTTGGTIASRVDYRTGGVRPVRDTSEILEFYPDLQEDGPVEVEAVFDRLSEEIDPDDWVTLAKRVAASFAAGAHGVVVAHGTDTLGYTAAALAFLYQRPPGPVVLVGAQRSPDRPSSDGFTNLREAVRVARHPTLAEPVVVMHAGPSDTRFSVHRATQVRKMHSSRRDAFETRNARPLGWVEGGAVTLDRPYRERSDAPPVLSDRLDRRGGLLWFYPGLAPEVAASVVEGWRGVVLAGTGLGHVSSVHLPWIREMVARGGVVAMTTQCLAGNVDPYVYSTGRELVRSGVVYLDDLLPEVAYVKLLWALGQSDDAAKVGRLLRDDQVGEFEPRHFSGGPA